MSKRTQNRGREWERKTKWTPRWTMILYFEGYGLFSKVLLFFRRFDYFFQRNLNFFRRFDFLFWEFGPFFEAWSFFSEKIKYFSKLWFFISRVLLFFRRIYYFSRRFIHFFFGENNIFFRRFQLFFSGILLFFLWWINPVSTINPNHQYFALFAPFTTFSYTYFRNLGYNYIIFEFFLNLF